MSSPSSSNCPSLGCSKPAIRRSKVVFPQPEGPSRVKNSLRAIVSETPSSARTSWEPPPKTFVRSRTSIAATVPSRIPSRYSPLLRIFVRKYFREIVGRAKGFCSAASVGFRIQPPPSTQRTGVFVSNVKSAFRFRALVSASSHHQMRQSADRSERAIEGGSPRLSPPCDGLDLPRSAANSPQPAGRSPPEGAKP